MPWVSQFALESNDTWGQRTSAVVVQAYSIRKPDRTLPTSPQLNLTVQSKELA